MSDATRVLVTGARGQLGRDLCDVLGALTPPGGDASWQPDGAPIEVGEFDVVALDHHDLDVTDESAVARALQMSRPNVVVNLAAYTKVDRAEEEADQCRLVNATAVGYLSRSCHEVGAHFITISTDYVFSGTKGAGYVEEDDTGPLNVYGRTKLEGEELVTAHDTVVRTSWLNGARTPNVIGAIINRARANEPLRFVSDQCGTFTASADLARALATIVRRRPGGRWHFANTGATTWFDIAQFVVQRCGSLTRVASITTDQLDPAPRARRPPRSDLLTEKWQHAGWSAPPTWQTALGRLVDSR